MSETHIRSRHVSDIVGFLVFSYFALSTVSKMPAVGFLLLPTIALEFFVAISFLIRKPLVAAVRSPRARFSAYGGSFLLLVFMQVAQRYFPDTLTPTDLAPLRAAGAFVWIAGSVWSAYSVWFLRHAFSIEAEARRLVTRGPYRFARHPVYTGYLGQYLGTWLMFPTLQFGLMFLIWILLMADRIRHEERVLSGAFPEYEDYRRRVGVLCTVAFRRAVPERTAVAIES